jgi:hypothetical protein
MGSYGDVEFTDSKGNRYVMTFNLDFYLDVFGKILVEYLKKAWEFDKNVNAQMLGFGTYLMNHVDYKDSFYKYNRVIAESRYCVSYTVSINDKIMVHTNDLNCGIEVDDVDCLDFQDLDEFEELVNDIPKYLSKKGIKFSVYN